MFTQLQETERQSGNTGSTVDIFFSNLKYLGWPYREYIKTAKNGGFRDELLSKNDFEIVLAIFCCYDYGTKTVQKITTDQKEYHKCSSCYILLNSQNIPINQKQSKKAGYQNTSDVAKIAAEVEQKKEQ